MTDPGPAESRRVRDTHLPERLAGQTVREVDRALRLHGGGEGLLDTTHFDTVRFSGVGAGRGSRARCRVRRWRSWARW